ncbi:MAG TPA: glutamate--tRNA ligase [Bacillota bacterium]|nr:glutamate--tRNA ligase [Bacillota bacterium]HOL08821.1 glutamate--tRNA ligase [Bacillota bacterium]HPO98761.1 glutamate--tRNA ligase [Bacillota bacterium]
MDQQEVRTRFAPSPTGYLHIGGARTAIYDWLLAKQRGGKFLLRIEDTDRNRFVPDSLADITASLRWLGLDWDEGPEVGGEYGPYFQSERLEIYHRYAEQLINEGKAYYCYCSAERLQELRQSQQQVGYDRHCRELSAEERQQLEQSGCKKVIRFKTPLSGKTVVKDGIRDEMSFDNSTLEDLVLIKSDGFPTYHFANVVDDHLMQVTHVLRGEEWIASTPVHVLLYQAFGWEPPQFVHLSIFLSPDGKGKLSKRHGATSAKEYREQGYLPEALFNFLLLLGWNPGTDQEIFSKEEAIASFSLERVNASPVRFSTDKLNWLNGVYIRKLTPVELANRCLPFLQKQGLLPEPCPADRFDYLVSLMPLVQERLKLLTEIGDWVDFFLKEEIETPGVELLIPKKMDQALTLKVLESVYTALEKVDDSFNEQELEAALHHLPEQLEIKAGQLFMPLRVAITGKTATPGIYETMHALGKGRVLKRVQAAIGRLREE